LLGGPWPSPSKAQKGHTHVTLPHIVFRSYIFAFVLLNMFLEVAKFENQKFSISFQSICKHDT
jgi:hypothetical protein